MYLGLFFIAVALGSMIAMVGYDKLAFAYKREVREHEYELLSIYYLLLSLTSSSIICLSATGILPGWSNIF